MTQPRKGYVLVEGHGEVKAAGNLLSRLSLDIGLSLPWSTPIRWPNLHLQHGLLSGARFICGKPDVGALLILQDEDDGCPKDRGPEMAEALRTLRLPFPSAVVLLHPEYEVLFLPCLDLMAGKPLGDRPGIQDGTTWGDGPWESKRGIKEWLTRHFPPGRIYKPTLDQLPMTRMLDLGRLRAAEVPCFGSLERALTFLGESLGTSGVYPR